MRHAVETGAKIQEELKLVSTDFIVNQVCYWFIAKYLGTVKFNPLLKRTELS